MRDATKTDDPVAIDCCGRAPPLYGRRRFTGAAALRAPPLYGRRRFTGAAALRAPPLYGRRRFTGAAALRAPPLYGRRRFTGAAALRAPPLYGRRRFTGAAALRAPPLYGRRRFTGAAALRAPPLYGRRRFTGAAALRAPPLYGRRRFTVHRRAPFQPWPCLDMRRSVQDSDRLFVTHRVTAPVVWIVLRHFCSRSSRYCTTTPLGNRRCHSGAANHRFDLNGARLSRI